MTPDVTADLRRAILSGDEPPGTLIPIDGVAEFFGVSQIPVREALKVLTGEGLVEHIPHIGYSVAKLTFEEFRELYDVRQALEAAALRGAVRHATSADDQTVRAAHDGLWASVEERDQRAYHLQSRRFHLALIAPARMERLVHMYESAWNITEPAQPMAHVAEENRRSFHDDHSRMVEAFVSRDADLLVQESQAHFESLKYAIEAFSDDPEVFRPER